MRPTAFQAFKQHPRLGFVGVCVCACADAWLTLRPTDASCPAPPLVSTIILFSSPCGAESWSQDSLEASPDTRRRGMCGKVCTTCMRRVKGKGKAVHHITGLREKFGIAGAKSGWGSVSGILLCLPAAAHFSIFSGQRPRWLYLISTSQLPLYMFYGTKKVIYN